MLSLLYGTIPQEDQPALCDSLIPLHPFHPDISIIFGCRLAFSSHRASISTTISQLGECLIYQHMLHITLHQTKEPFFSKGGVEEHTGFIKYHTT